MPRPSWIEFDPAKVTGKLISSPDRADLPFELNEQAIVLLAEALEKNGHRLNEARQTPACLFLFLQCR